MAKKELQYTPLLGQFMTLSNAVFVNRSRRADAVAVFAKVAETMKKKVVSLFVSWMQQEVAGLAGIGILMQCQRYQLSLFIFPEGTRSASPLPTLLPFKKGAFHLAVAAQLPLIPIVCENYSAAYSAQAKRFPGGDLIIKGKSSHFAHVICTLH